MNLGRMIRRVGPPLLAFVVAALGALLLIGGQSGGSSGDPADLPTVVAVADIPAGTPVAGLGALVEVRSVPTDARALGAVERVDDLPDGVLDVAMVPGQQLLATSVAPDPRDDIGDELVAISATLEPQKWVGPVATTGDRVAVFAIGGEEGQLIASDVLVIDAPPDPSILEPTEQVVVTLGVPRLDAARVVGAIAGSGIWLVSS
jgi:hypothetical protein